MPRRFRRVLRQNRPGRTTGPRSSVVEAETPLLMISKRRLHQDSFVLLLVDSEDAVAPGTDPWVHLKGRDGWEKPAGATDDHAHLMVQCTESWFLADRNVLVEYYGQGFNQGALPANPHFEQIPKEDVLGGLRNATRATKTKGVYSKVRHGYQLVALLDPVSVRNASPYAERLCALVVDRLADP